ncbi:MAG: hypothetical protein WCD81_10440, partial [Candidatus Bathyarchaeia archaeon]
MLLCEPERNLSAEQSLINDTNLYGANSTSFGTIHDYGNITVPAGGSLVAFSLETLLAHISFINGAVLAIQVGSLKYVAGYYYDNNGPDEKHLGALIWLSAGTYDISVVGLVPDITETVEIYNMKVGLVQFNDVQPSALAYYTAATNSIQLTVPNRTLPVGSLNQAVFAINICTSGTLGSTFVLTVDGVAHTDMDESSWLEYPGIQQVNGYDIYKFYIPLSVGVQHTIGIALSGGAVAYASVIACPWICALAGRRHNPLKLSFSQLST